MLSYDVYKITNKLNNKHYIGITSKGISARIKEHIYTAERDPVFPIHRALNKYGKDNFTFELLDFSCNSWEELTEKEKYYINLYKSNDREFGYNLTEGGDGTVGYKHTEEAKIKMSIASSGREVTEASRLKLSEAGKKRTEGRVAYWESGTQGSTRRKPILQYTKEGIYIREFDGVNIAAKETGISASIIITALKGKAVLASKKNPYIWVYKSDYPDVPNQVSASLYAKNPDWKPTISEECRKADLASRKNRDYAKRMDTLRENGMACAKAVEQYDKDGNLLNTFFSISDAARITGCDRKGISRQLKNPTSIENARAWSNLKYVWKYKTN